MSCQGVEAAEAAGELEAEAVEEDGLGGFGFGDVAEADGFLGAIRGLCRQHDVAEVAQSL